MFRNAEEAWFWTMGVLIARREGAVRSRPGIPRPCEPNDILRCLDVLYRSRRIDLIHARVLRIWGERQMVPPSSWQGEHGHAVLCAKPWSSSNGRCGSRASFADGVRP